MRLRPPRSTGSSYWRGRIVRYLVKARVKQGQEKPLLQAIDDETLGQGSIAGDEYQQNMKLARVDPAGVATWVETCFCDPPLEEERPYWEKYFELLAVKDAHARRNCRHESGTEAWACCDCDCTEKLEKELQGEGESFLAKLRSAGSSSTSSASS
jgi:hypothetical protein